MKYLLASVLFLTACADQGKGPEEDAPSADGKADSFAKPTDHGALAFGTAAKASLAGAAEYHTWEFSLAGAASVHAFTSRIPHARTLDTVLYLYKKQASGTWGPYLARNDDAASTTVLSALTRSLDAGDYRILVKGHDATVAGPFGVEVDCTGAGCAPTPPPAASCLFGTFADDFRSGTDATLLHNAHDYKSLADYTADNRPAVIGADIVAAMRDSGWTDTTTVADAFGHADGGEIIVDYIYDTIGARAFVAIEYWLGDNPYGAIFADGTGALVAGMHDSDITSCTVAHATCALHQNWGDLRADAAWTKVSQRTVTAASQLSGTQATDALAAIRVAYRDAASLADGLTKIGDGQLDVLALRNGATTVEVYDYSAGDNTYGAIYVAGTTTLAAEIHDGDFYGCTLLQ